MQNYTNAILFFHKLAFFLTMVGQKTFAPSAIPLFNGFLVTSQWLWKTCCDPRSIGLLSRRQWWLHLQMKRLNNARDQQQTNWKIRKPGTFCFKQLIDNFLKPILFVTQPKTLQTPRAKNIKTLLRWREHNYRTSQKIWNSQYESWRIFRWLIVREKHMGWSHRWRSSPEGV